MKSLSVKSPAVTCDVVSDAAGLVAVRDEWDVLLACAQEPSIFLSWEWMTSWLHTQRAPGAPHLILVRDAGDRSLAGIAPLYRSGANGAAALRSMTFMGTGVGADHLAFLCRPGLERTVYQAVVTSLLSMSTWDILELPRMDERHAAYAQEAMATCSDGALTVSTTVADECPLITLPPTWEEYLRLIGKNARKGLVRLTRRLEERGAVVFQRVRSAAEFGRAWDVLLRLHQMRRQALGDPSAFIASRTVAIHEHFARLALERGWLRFYVLLVDGEAVAAQYCLRMGRGTAAVQTGFDVGWARFGVGRILMGHAIRASIEEGDAEFDFLRGAEAYKEQQWAAVVREDISLVATRRHPRVRLMIAIRAQSRAVKDRMRDGLRAVRALATSSAPATVPNASPSTQTQSDGHLCRLKEARRRDHRTIGRQLDLFRIIPEVGPGLPLWQPKGATIRRIVERYIVDLEVAGGYQHVYSQEIASSALYKLSGHWEHYRENMYPPMQVDEEELVLRPMNCPHHIMIYKTGARSYRELPIRIAELGKVYRYERSGVLTGLARVRGMTMNDAHIFLRPDQIKDEIVAVMRLIQRVYADFRITGAWYRLSLRDPDRTKFIQNDALWAQAQEMLRGALRELGIEFQEAPGEAAFYGPKIDVQVPTAAGKDETVSTIQLDFLLPERFELEYRGEDGNAHRPVMIHRAVTSTMERWVAMLIEQYEGRFPLWLAPEQGRVLPIADRHVEYARQVRAQLAAAGLRVDIDPSAEPLGYKIRRAHNDRVPYMAVVGDREIAEHTVSVRGRATGNTGPAPVDEFINQLQRQVTAKE